MLCVRAGGQSAAKPSDSGDFSRQSHIKIASALLIIKPLAIFHGISKPKAVRDVNAV